MAVRQRLWLDAYLTHSPNSLQKSSKRFFSTSALALSSLQILFLPILSPLRCGFKQHGYRIKPHEQLVSVS